MQQAPSPPTVFPPVQMQPCCAHHGLTNMLGPATEALWVAQPTQNPDLKPVRNGTGNKNLYSFGLGRIDGPKQ